MNCLRCNAPLPPSAINTDRLVPCGVCGAKTRADLFPAALKTTEQAETGQALVDGQSASCFYHPDKKAVVPCGSCGRFLCALCDVDFSGEHLCFTCLESGKKKKKRVDLENHRTLYDGIALRLALVPMVIFWFTALTAPAALYIAVRHFNTPTSIIPRTRIRYIIAGVVSILQIAAWAVGIYYYARKA